jgi:hypothetical protein
MFNNNNVNPNTSRPLKRKIENSPSNGNFYQQQQQQQLEEYYKSDVQCATPNEQYLLFKNNNLK